MSDPRLITPRELRLIECFSSCELALTPQQMQARWQIERTQIATICNAADVTVNRWFSWGQTRQHPNPYNLQRLALADILLEFYEELPGALIARYCHRGLR